MAAVRQAVAKYGVEEAHQILLSKASTGAGRDLFIYHRFLWRHGEALSKPVSADTTEGFLSCAASAGLNDAIELGQGHLRALSTPAGTKAADCIDSKKREGTLSSGGTNAWLACRAEEILPRCPLAK